MSLHHVSIAGGSKFLDGQFALVAVILGILLGLVVIFALFFLVYRRKYKSLKRRVPSAWYMGRKSVRDNMVSQVTSNGVVFDTDVKSRTNPTYQITHPGDTPEYHVIDTSQEDSGNEEDLGKYKFQDWFKLSKCKKCDLQTSK